MIQVEIKFSHFLSTQYHNTWGAVVFKLNTRVPIIMRASIRGTEVDAV